MPVLVARSQKYVEYSQAFHLLERSFFCEGVTNKTMGYEIILIAHFFYVLVIYSSAVKGFQPYLFILVEWFRCLPLEVGSLKASTF